MESLYSRLPWQAQEIAVSVEGARIARQRYGGTFSRYAQQYEERATWPEDAIVAFRQVRLAEALQRASRAPYYRDLFRSLGARWQDFCSAEAFSELPVITKADLQQRGSEFEVRPARKDDIIISTSGTTASSLSLPSSGNVDPEQWAVWWRYRKWHGIKRSTPLALFASSPVVPSSADGRFARHNLLQRETRYSVYHIRPETVSDYVSRLSFEQKPWIHGNPSAIALLANLMNRSGLSLTYRPKWVTTGSENLTSNFRESISQAFGVTPIQHYGLAEGNANFSECESGRLHVDEDYAYVEFLPAGTGGQKIVGTSFSNNRTAILRYETGDLGTVLDEVCSCGRWGRVVESLDGREGDYVTLPSGVKVASLASPFHGTSWMAEGQLYQDESGDLEVRYVPRRAVSREEIDVFEESLRRRVGPDISIRFREFTSIPRTGRGKLRLVVSDYVTN